MSRRHPSGPSDRVLRRGQPAVSPPATLDPVIEAGSPQALEAPFASPARGRSPTRRQAESTHTDDDDDSYADLDLGSLVESLPSRSPSNSRSPASRFSRTRLISHPTPVAPARRPAQSPLRNQAPFPNRTYHPRTLFPDMSQPETDAQRAMREEREFERQRKREEEEGRDVNQKARSLRFVN
jgi:hypothetical protein